MIEPTPTATPGVWRAAMRTVFPGRNPDSGSRLIGAALGVGHGVLLAVMVAVTGLGFLASFAIVIAFMTTVQLLINLNRRRAKRRSEAGASPFGR
jgi:hypothetical protein